MNGYLNATATLLPSVAAPNGGRSYRYLVALYVSGPINTPATPTPFFTLRAPTVAAALAAVTRYYGAGRPFTPAYGYAATRIPLGATYAYSPAYGYGAYVAVGATLNPATGAA